MAEKNLGHLRKFVAPEFVFGAGARGLVAQYAKNLGAKKILLVTGRKLAGSIWVSEILQLLDAVSIKYEIYNEASPNPRDYEVMRGVETYNRENCDLILAVGGGSSMDCAKGIGIVANNGGHILDYEGVDEVPAPIPPLVCIPTTSGSSADVSQFAIIADVERKVKIAIVSKAVVPDVALIDPEITTSMSAELTAHTGLDALTHAMEALVSNASSPITDLHAMKALELIFANLLQAIENPEDIVYRTNMSLGSMHAGLAFSNASLGAAHAMSHSIGGVYDLPHGLCNAVLLPHVIKFNYSSAAEIYDRISALIGLDLDGLSSDGRRDALVEYILDFSHKAEVSQSLASLGINSDALEGLSRRAMNDACMVTNPVIPEQEDIIKVYEEAI